MLFLLTCQLFVYTCVSWTWATCCLLVLHNETINIWTHLIGFVFFVGIFIRDILFLIPAKDSGVEVAYSDFFVLCSLIICYQVRILFKMAFNFKFCNFQGIVCKKLNFWKFHCRNLKILRISKPRTAQIECYLDNMVQKLSLFTIFYAMALRSHQLLTYVVLAGNFK